MSTVISVVSSRLDSFQTTVPRVSRDDEADWGEEEEEEETPKGEDEDEDDM